MTPAEMRATLREAKRRVLRHLRMELAAYSPFWTSNALERAECREGQRLLRLAIRAVTEAKQ